MSRGLYYLLTFILLSGCSKNDTPSPVLPPPITIKDTTGLLWFKTIPQSATQVKLSVLCDPNSGMDTAYLQKDGATVGAYAFSREVPASSWSAIITYNFTTDAKYDFMIRAKRTGNTALRYTIPGYKHVYLATFNYQKLIAFKQTLGMQAIDITPSHNYIYFTDDSINILSTKKLSLKDGSVQVIRFPDTLSQLRIRAISDDELILMGNTKSQLGRYTNDTSMLFRYNTATGKTTFLDYVSSDYGRISRVIDNHLIATKPYFSSAHSTLIDLNDNSTRDLGLIDFRYIDEVSYDHLYYYNQLVDPATGAFQSVVPSADSNAVEYLDNTTNYTIASRYIFHPDSGYFSRLVVYSGGAPVYQGSYTYNRSPSIPRLTHITGNRMLYHQQYGYDVKFNTDGYYVLDLNTRQEQLIHCDSDPYAIWDFQPDAHTTISVRADGIYRITNP